MDAARAAERTDSLLPAHARGRRRAMLAAGLLAALLIATGAVVAPVASADPSWGSPVAVDPSFAVAAVSCASASFCVAVDRDGMAAGYDGHAWSTPADVDPQQSFAAVSCVPGFCAAVDDAGDAFTYDGSTWSEAVAVDGSGLAFDSVSCASASFCMAAGEDGEVSIYDGRQWSVPVDIGAGYGLKAVSCPTNTFCAAAADDGGATAVQTFDGSGWSALTTIGSHAPASLSCATAQFCALTDYAGEVATFAAGTWSSFTQLAGGPGGLQVSCASAAACVAGDSLGFTYSFDGSAWSSGEATTAGAVAALSCAPASTFCVAFDSTQDALTDADGIWSGPTPVGGQGLTGVSCPVASWCVAVDGSGRALTYSGGAWSGAQEVDPHGLTAVSCASQSFCVAIDGDGNAVTYRGHPAAWATPQATGGGDLTAVSCPSASFCVAVDSAGQAVTFQSSSWSGPADVDSSIPLESVSCTADGFCAAVDGAGNAVTRSSGGVWSVTDIDGTWRLTAVSCAADGSCTALDSSGNELVLQGGSWSPASSVDSDDWLTAASCPPGGSFCAAGDADGNLLGGSGGFGAPATVDPGDWITSISCASASFCAAVDEDGNVLTLPGAIAAAPSASAPPTIAGTAAVGDVLTESHGAWSGAPSVYSYRWLRCDAQGADCSAIAGGTSQDYTLTAADDGQTIAVEETALAPGVGSGPATVSQATPLVARVAPVNSSPPVLAGSTVAGAVLSLSGGTWLNGPTSLADQWESCDADGAGCQAIPGATAASYTLGASDVGHTLVVVQTASNALGAAQATTAPSGLVTPPVPVSAAPPAISGATTAGDVLSETRGTWSGSPTGYVEQWQRCDASGAACQEIAGATGTAYTLTSADVGHALVVVETASNAGGGTAAASPPTAAVASATSPARATTTALAPSATPVTTGAQVTFTAAVAPAPDGGTVAFTQDGQTLAGCGAAPVNSTFGIATCEVTYASPGTHAIVATYSGDAGYGASSSTAVTEVVTAPAPQRSQQSVELGGSGGSAGSSGAKGSPGRTASSAGSGLRVVSARQASGGRAIAVTIAVPSTGTLTLVVKGTPARTAVRAQSRRASAAQTEILTRALSAHASRLLAAGRSVTVTITVTFTPRSGRSLTRTKRVKLAGRATRRR